MESIPADIAQVAGSAMDKSAVHRRAEQPFTPTADRARRSLGCEPRTFWLHRRAAPQNKVHVAPEDDF